MCALSMYDISKASLNKGRLPRYICPTSAQSINKSYLGQCAWIVFAAKVWLLDDQCSESQQTIEPQVFWTIFFRNKKQQLISTMIHRPLRRTFNYNSFAIKYTSFSVWTHSHKGKLRKCVSLTTHGINLIGSSSSRCVRAIASIRKETRLPYSLSQMGISTYLFVILNWKNNYKTTA